MGHCTYHETSCVFSHFTLVSVLFPSTCTYLVTFTDTTNGHYKTLMDGNPIEFTLFAVNGAGSGMAATTTYKYPGLVSKNASEATGTMCIMYVHDVLTHKV